MSAGFLLTAAAVYGLVTLGSDATASRATALASPPAISIVSSPTVQTLEPNVVATADGKTHTRRPTVLFGTAKFTITVTNTDLVGLINVATTDPLSPGCSRRIGTLAPGVSVAYHCSAANVRRNYTNRVTVSGQSQKGARVLGDAKATASARATVKVKPKTVHVPHNVFHPPPQPKPAQVAVPHLAFTG